MAIGAGVAVVAGAAALFLRPDGGRRLHSWQEGKGPLWGGSATFNGGPAVLNGPHTFGFAGVSNLSDKTAVLETVRVRPPLPAGLEIIGTGATGPNRKVPTVATAYGFPPPGLQGAMHALAGTRVPPATRKAGRAGVDLIFGLKVTKPGIWGFAQVDLDYRVGKKEYTVRLDHGVYLCAPEADYPTGCHGEEYRKSLQRAVGINED